MSEYVHLLFFCRKPRARCCESTLWW